MVFFAKSKYGTSTTTRCTHCDGVATIKDAEGFPVCKGHKNEPSPRWLCPCSQPLYPHESKHGVFFLCMNCGPVSFAKAKDFNTNNNTGIKFNLNKSIKQKQGV